MKAILIIICLCFIFFNFSCAGNNKNATDNKADTTTINTNEKTDSLVTGKIIPQVLCKSDASQSYALYIPDGKNNDTLLVIYFFDPHADGALPLSKYKELADKYGFILIGSNNSKNGNDWTTTESIWTNLFNDSKERLAIHSTRIYTCGFSGGAKVASYIALQHSFIKGVIAGGAALPDGTAPGNFNFSFTAIAGEGDMNMTDLVSISNELDRTQTQHRIIFFNGKHEWCPQSAMDIAFAGLELDAMRTKEIAADKIFINAFVEGSKKRLNAFIAANDFISAQRECTLSERMLNGLGDAGNFFRDKNAAIQKSEAYQNQLKVQQALFEREQNMKTIFQQQFEQGDMNYWNETINDLKTKSKATTQEAAMYQRLLAYLSLAFYSISNQLINANQNEQAAYFVQLYKMADPSNSEAWYFSAIINARNNNAKATEEDLLKAAENGFTDETRMMHQPDFQAVATQINFSKIETEMHTKK